MVRWNESSSSKIQDSSDRTLRWMEGKRKQTKNGKKPVREEKEMPGSRQGWNGKGKEKKRRSDTNRAWGNALGRVRNAGSLQQRHQVSWFEGSM
ncbi:hypothetical protein TNCT_210561 [Trichonephila clavata]|uniref:Uncharacterized protein n=1 Tax=Trichonephila clavata TaxID=2740835 RepID=A0A8X6LF35_TRICU|nr:hypothetical protein TNCT_210561 [Trichonephila clavata]